MKGPTTGAAAATFLAAIAGIAAGIGVGWLLFAGGESSDAAAPATRPVHERPADPVIATAPESARRGENGTTAADAVAERAIAEAMKVRFDFPSFDGTGVIRGSVKSDTGEPVEGVEIVAYADSPDEWQKETTGRRWDEIPIEESLLRSARNRRWWDLSRKRTVSAADGTFELKGLADMGWWLQPRADGWSIEWTPQDPTRVGAVVELKASRSVSFDLDVRLPDGSGAADARLYWNAVGSEDNSSWTWTRGSGPVWMKPGKWRLSARTGDDERFVASPTDVEIQPGMSPLTLRMRTRAGIVVKLRTPDGFTGLRARCFVVRDEETELTDDEIRATSSKRSDERNGPFEWDLGIFASPRDDRRPFLDITPGRWVVAAGFDGAPLDRRTLHVVDAVVDCELAAPAPDPSQFVEVRVAGPDGSPIASANFDWEYRAERGTAVYGAQAITRGGGVWLLRRVAPGERAHSSSGRSVRAPGGQWFVSVTVDGFLPQEEAISGARLDVRLRVPATAVVRLSGLSEGADVTRFTVSMSDVQTGRYLGNEVRSDGPTRLTPFAPGRHDVRLHFRANGSEVAMLTVLRQTVDMVDGENAIELRAPAFHPLDLDLGAARADDRCVVVRVAEDEDGEGIYLELDHVGRAKLDLVPEGSYRLLYDRNEDDEGKTKEFRVPETRTLKLP